MANAVGFDSIKMMNKIEEDQRLRAERQRQIAEEIKREQAIAMRQAEERKLK